MAVYEIAARKKKNLQLRRQAAAAAAQADDVEKHARGEEDDEEEDDEEEREADVIDEGEEDVDSDDEELEEEEEEAAEVAPTAAATAAKRGAAAGASSSSSSSAAAAATRVEFSEPAQWVERMALTSTRSLPGDLNADDDPKREEAFIQQTLLSVTRGIALLEEAKVPWRRPDDYYAEMYKSDVHMNDVRQAMEASKARIEAQAHRRSMKEQKKYGKEVQAEVLRQRAKYKRDMQDSLSDWRKKRRGNGSLQDMLNEDEDGGEREAKRSKTQRTARPRNLRPGGGGSKRPGKNARRRR